MHYLPPYWYGMEIGGPHHRPRLRSARRRLSVLTLATGVLLTTPGVRGQPADAGALLSGQLDVARLVDLAAQRLNLNIEYDGAALKSPVTLRIGAALSDEELWTLLNRVLASRGFTTVRTPGRAAYSVVKIADAPGLARLMPEADPAGPEAGFRAVAVRAGHRSGKELIDAISKVLSKPSGSVSAMGDGGLLLIADLSPRVDQALELLKLIDTPGSATVVHEVPVGNLTPQQVVAAVSQVAAKRDAISGDKTPGDVIASPNGKAVLLISPQARLEYWKGLIASLDQREGVETATYTPRYFAPADVAELIEQTTRDSADDRWRVVIDELTGSLVITATPSQHESIRAQMERLASTPTEARRPLRAFVIRNRSVNEVQSVLEQLLQAGVIEAAADAPPTDVAPGAPPDRVTVAPMPPPPAGQGAGVPPVSSPFLPRAARHESVRGQATGPRGDTRERALTLSADEGTNTLMAVGEPRLLAQIETLLTTLDVRQPQVMLEVLMVTLSEGQTLDLGAELQQIQVSGSVRLRLSSLFGLGAGGAGGPGSPAADGSGLTGSVLSPGDFSVLVRALQTVSRGRSLSMPKVLVGNNQQATLDSVTLQPYASLNASNTVSSTSYGGSADAGTTVSIKPQIAEGDHLVLDYSVSLSSFVGNSSAATLPPPKQQNRVQSAATIPDGYTVVVGGIDLEGDSASVSQVPVLGSIPVIGEVFKSRSTSRTRSRFYVFIRANILRIRGFEDLKYISDRDVAKAEVNDGLPRVEPRVIR